MLPSKAVVLFELRSWLKKAILGPKWVLFVLSNYQHYYLTEFLLKGFKQNRLNIIYAVIRFQI
ncbi:hypothetical protein SAMN05444673_6989 [Bacillus sp. OV166]|nr:hypothetical protein SAMN05444673_6989 [Bacillus sp. OV166]